MNKNLLNVVSLIFCLSTLALEKGHAQETENSSSCSLKSQAELDGLTQLTQEASEGQLSWKEACIGLKEPSKDNQITLEEEGIDWRAFKECQCEPPCSSETLHLLSRLLGSYMKLHDNPGSIVKQDETYIQYCEKTYKPLISRRFKHKFEGCDCGATVEAIRLAENLETAEN